MIFIVQNKDIVTLTTYYPRSLYCVKCTKEWGRVINYIARDINLEKGIAKYICPVCSDKATIEWNGKLPNQKKP